MFCSGAILPHPLACESLEGLKPGALGPLLPQQPVVSPGPIRWTCILVADGLTKSRLCICVLPVIDTRGRPGYVCGGGEGRVGNGAKAWGGVGWCGVLGMGSRVRGLPWLVTFNIPLPEPTLSCFDRQGDVWSIFQSVSCFLSSGWERGQET